MKRKIFVILSVCCLLFVACGEKEEQNNTPVEEKMVIEENTKAVIEEVTEDEITVEPVEEPEETMTDEVVGDVDITSGELTLEDMQELVVGLDIPVNVVDEGSDETFKDFTLLFPGSVYITDYTNSGLRANLESIDFNIKTTTQVDTPSNNIREDIGETQETIGKYVLETSPGANDKYGYQTTYFICDTSNDTVLRITLTINKTSEYQEYCDSLVEEFIPAFEETLRKNLQ